MNETWLERLNPDNYRRFFWFYALVTLVGLLILYKKFIFSGGMLAGADMVSAGVFFRSFLVDHVREFGTVPIWNPFIFGGLPFVDAFHGDIFYPLSFLKYFGNIFRMLGFTLVLHVYLAGIFAYLTARQLKMSKLAAAMVGIAYMFSGWLNGLMAPGHDGKMFVTALFPLTILFLDRAFVKDRVLNFTMLGVVIGLIILTPHPQLAYYSLWALCGYTVYKLIALMFKTRRIVPIIAPGLLTLYAVFLGICLSAIQMLPGYIYTRNDSPRVDFAREYRFAISFSLHPEEAISMVVPDFCGVDEAQGGQRRYWGRNSFKDNSEYAGLAPLLLALVGVFYGRGRKRFFFGLMGAGSLLYAMGDHTPFFRLCYDIVPLVKSTRAPSMVSFLFSFAVSILAGFGVDALRRRGRGYDFRFKMPLSVLIYSLPVMLLVGTAAFMYAPEKAHYLYLKFMYPEILDNVGKLAYARNNFSAMSFGFLSAFIISLVVAGAYGLSRHRRLGFVLLILLPLVAMADGIRFNRQFVRVIDPVEEFRLRPEVDFIINNVGNHRAFGFACDELGMQFYYHGIKSTIGLHGNQLRNYSRLLTYRHGLSGNFINPRFANLAGAKYIVMPVGMDYESLKFADGDLVSVEEFGKFGVIENRACFPRAYLAGEYRVFDEVDSLIHQVYYSDDDLRRMVYLLQEPEMSCDSLVSAGDTAEIVHYGIDSILIRASCSTPKILILSDNYYKDWHVFVGGEEREPIVTYGTFRGVAIGSGEHTVVWKYIPSNYAIGKTITLFAVFYVFIILGVFWWRRNKMRAHPLSMHSYSVFL